MRSALWVITQRTVVILHRRFGTTYLVCLQVSKIHEKVFFLDFLTLEDVTDSFPETSVRNYHHTLRDNLEEGTSHFQTRLIICP
jgi:hypothetical protein